MRLRKSATIGLPAFAAAACALTQSAVAQEAESGSGAENVLQEIIVYGRSVIDTTLDIPQTVDVIDADMLQAINTDRVGDALRFVPGASAQGSNLDAFGDDYLIRGFDSAQTVNGIGKSNLNHARDAVNIERVEVLKGPASVLYGQLNPGAVINIVTKQPLDEFFAEVGIEAARYDAYRATVDLTGPLAGDRLKFRLTGAYEDADTFVDFWSRKHQFISPVLSFEPTESTKLTLEALYSEDKWKGFYNGIPAEGTILPNPNGEIPINRTLTDPSFDGTLRKNTDVSARIEHAFSENVALRAAASWTSGKQDYAEIFGVVGWEDESLRRLIRAVLDSNFNNDVYGAHVDLSFGFDTGAIKHQLVVGADYERQEFDSTDLATIIPGLDLFDPVYSPDVQPPPFFAVFDLAGKQKVDSHGVFLQDRIELTEQLRVIGGLRYSKLDEKTTNTDLTDPSAPFTSVFVQEPDKWTSQLGLLYSPRENLSIFASRTTSFLAIQGSVFGGAPLKPETGIQYELGVKTGSSRMTATAALFQTTRDNVAVSDRENPSFSVQVGEQEAKGIEVSVNALLMDHWRLYAGYAYTDAEVTKETDPTILGLPLLNVAKNTASAFTEYEFGGPLSGLALGASVNYVSDREGNLDQTFRFDVPSYVRVDVNASYEFNRNFDVRVYVENAADEDYFEHGLGRFEVWPGAPRTYGIALTARM